jgi:hypothetical protein
LGSTGWLRGILAGAAGIASALTGRALEIGAKQAVAWDADYLYFSVREPWPSKGSAAAIAFGKITPDNPLALVSHMPEHGVIFSDGIESDFLQFNSGAEAVIGLAEKKGRLVA